MCRALTSWLASQMSSVSAGPPADLASDRSRDQLVMRLLPDRSTLSLGYRATVQHQCGRGHVLLLPLQELEGREGGCVEKQLWA